MATILDSSDIQHILIEDYFYWTALTSGERTHSLVIFYSLKAEAIWYWAQNFVGPCFEERKPKRRGNYKSWDLQISTLTDRKFNIYHFTYFICCSTKLILTDKKDRN